MTRKPPRHDFLRPAPTLTIVCEPCGRRGQCNVERLIAKHGRTSDTTKGR